MNERVFLKASPNIGSPSHKLAVFHYIISNGTVIRPKFYEADIP